MIKCAYKNILESGSVSLEAGTAHADYPLYRLYDRHIGRIFKTTAAETTEVKIDQGEAVSFSDNFDDNSIDTDKWNETDSSSNINETNQRIEGKGDNNWNTNGLVSNDSFALVKGMEFKFTVSFQHSNNNPLIAGVINSPSLATTGTQGCSIRFGQSPYEIDMWVNGAHVELAGTYQYAQDKTYNCRIVYMDPGWRAFIQSDDDSNYSAEKEIYSTATDSTGPMYFQANFFSGSGWTWLNDVEVNAPSGSLAVDRLLIPSGHNLAGMTLGLRYSDDDINWHQATANFTGAAGLINKDVKEGEELIRNGDFETGDFTAWTAQDSVIDDTTVKSGSYSSKLEATGTAVNGPMTDPIYIDTSKRYRIIGWNNITEYSSGWYMFRLQFQTKAGAYITHYNLLGLGAVTSGFVQTQTIIGPPGSGADITYPDGAARIILYTNFADPSPTGVAYLDDVSVVMLDDLDTHRYWKFIVDSPASIPELGELFLTSTYEWELDPSYPIAGLEDVFNVENLETAAGGDRFLEHGDPKRHRDYTVQVAGEAQKTNVQALYDAWAGKKPFWLEDLDGAWIYGKLQSPMDLTRTSYQLYDFRFDFLEVLP